MTLPTELYQYILQIKSKTAWEKRKLQIHKKLNLILPSYEHESHFTFNNYNVYYVRTLHQDFTITIRRNNYIEISQVVYLFQQAPNSDCLLSTKFWYLPPNNFQGYREGQPQGQPQEQRRGIRLPLPFHHED